MYFVFLPLLPSSFTKPSKGGILFDHKIEPRVDLFGVTSLWGGGTLFVGWVDVRSLPMTQRSNVRWKRCWRPPFLTSWPKTAKRPFQPCRFVCAFAVYGLQSLMTFFLCVVLSAVYDPIMFWGWNWHCFKLFLLSQKYHLTTFPQLDLSEILTIIFSSQLII